MPSAGFLIRHSFFCTDRLLCGVGSVFFIFLFFFCVCFGEAAAVHCSGDCSGATVSPRTVSLHLPIVYLTHLHAYYMYHCTSYNMPMDVCVCVLQNSICIFCNLVGFFFFCSELLLMKLLRSEALIKNLYLYGFLVVADEKIANKAMTFFTRLGREFFLIKTDLLFRLTCLMRMPRRLIANVVK